MRTIPDGCARSALSGRTRATDADAGATARWTRDARRACPLAVRRHALGSSTRLRVVGLTWRSRPESYARSHPGRAYKADVGGSSPSAPTLVRVVFRLHADSLPTRERDAASRCPRLRASYAAKHREPDRSDNATARGPMNARRGGCAASPLARPRRLRGAGCVDRLVSAEVPSARSRSSDPAPHGPASPDRARSVLVVGGQPRVRRVHPFGVTSGGVSARTVCD